jgi:hypothetical protein
VVLHGCLRLFCVDCVSGVEKVGPNGRLREKKVLFFTVYPLLSHEGSLIY